MPDFFTFIPDNYRNQTDFSRDKADFQHIQMDKTPLDADGIIWTFTLKGPCPYGKKQKLSVKRSQPLVLAGQSISPVDSSLGCRQHSSSSSGPASCVCLCGALGELQTMSPRLVSGCCTPSSLRVQGRAMEGLPGCAP